MEKWWKKLWKLVFDGDEEIDDLVEEKQMSRPGRIPRTGKENRAKVIHEYPQTGNFRFPLIPDKHEPTYRKEREVMQNKTTSHENETFTKKNFKPSNVPSPVFGFRERLSVTESTETLEESVPEMASPVFHDDIQPPEAIEAEAVEPEVIVQEELFEEERIERNIEPVPEEVQPVVLQEEQQPVRNEMNKRQDAQQTPKTSISEKRMERQSLPKQKQAQTQSVPYNVMMFAADHKRNYFYPKLQLLDTPVRKQEDSKAWLSEQEALLNDTLKNFNVNAVVINTVKGPSVTRFEVQPSPGVKVSKITNLSDDIKLSLSAKEIRIEAPIPGKNAIGIEVPNRSSQPVGLRDILESRDFQSHPSPLAAALGVDIAGKPFVTDLKKMPHGLIAGATGSGKSVCINSILASLLYKANPDDVKLMLIDPKVVELAPYNELPHLVTPVVTDVKDATLALKWAVEEMESRYKKFAKFKVRDIDRYNENVKKQVIAAEKMPYLVIIIDELADLMMVSPQEVEDAICRIAQKARACGIHLLVATQRPSVDVITGLIKANIPTRIAFSVSSQVDSRTIIDSGGAEKLLGKGDMLFLENGSPKPVRLQGNFVSDEEIERITHFIKKQRKPKYLIEMDDLATYSNDEQEDDLFLEACEFIFEQGAASSSSLQRRFRIGYNRAARLVDMMEEHGIVSKANGSKPRKVMMTKQEFHDKVSKHA